MSQRIVYLNDDGSVAVIVPYLGSGLSISQIAAKDVPSGKPFKIIDASDVPQDRSGRHLWSVDASDLTDGVGANYGAGSNIRVLGWNADGSPILGAAE